MKNNLFFKQMSQVLSIYNKRDKEKLFLVALSQVFLAFLDLLGVALLGVIGALSVYGIQSKSPGNRIAKLLDWVNLENLTFQKQVAVLGCIAAIVLIIKTLVSIYLVKKTINFVSLRGAIVSSNLLRNLFSKPILEINKYSNQEIIFSITTGIENLTSRVIGSSLTIFSDTVLLIVLFLGLFIVNPTISLSIFIVFGTLGIILSKYTKSISYRLGEQESRLAVQSYESILESLNAYREISVGNRRHYYFEKISKMRFGLADVYARRNFMPNLSKYIFEIALIIGSILISGVQFALYNSSQAIASLTIFLAASTRIAPAILRIQQGSSQLRVGLGNIESTLKIISDFSSGEHQALVPSRKEFDHFGFNPEIQISNLSYAYKNGTFRIEDLSLTIEPGSQVAFTGTSGAGKTTLIDLILGLHPNDSDAVKISGLTPLSAYVKWPGAVAYVPQNIIIMNSSIKENVCQGFDFEINDEQQIWAALDKAHLGDFVRKLPDGLNTQVGEFGNKLSGGQRQRLGIARALFTSPKLIVFDEATSALDGETEAAISQTLRDLKGECTLLLIAHRVSSIMNSDKIVFMEHGEIIAEGTFDEVVKKSKSFESQVKKMMLSPGN
jgi:ATP-binding cassette subfamily C protein